jgi:hypothetical protein
VTFVAPETGEKPRLVAIVGATNCATEEHQATMTLAGAEHLPRVPWKRRSVEGNQYQPVLTTGHQQCGIVQAEAGSVLPGRNMDDGKFADQLPTR